MQSRNNLNWLSHRYRVQHFFTRAPTFLIAFLLIYAPVNAAESSTMDWQSEWQRVMTAAKKEG